MAVCATFVCQVHGGDLDAAHDGLRKVKGGSGDRTSVGLCEDLGFEEEQGISKLFHHNPAARPADTVLRLVNWKQFWIAFVSSW